MNANVNFANKCCFLSIIQHMGYKPSGDGCWSCGEKQVELHDANFTRANGETVTYEHRIEQFNNATHRKS